MFEVGRVCVKLAGRDAGKHCVVVEELDKGFVLVDGQTRRRKVSTAHLIPLEKTLGVSKGADHAAVEAAFQELNIAVKTTTPKKVGDRPRKVRKVKQKVEKSAKKEAKKESPKKKAAKKAPAKSMTESAEKVEKSE